MQTMLCFCNIASGSSKPLYRYGDFSLEVSAPFLFRENRTHGEDGRTETDGEADGVQHLTRPMEGCTMKMVFILDILEIHLL